MSALIDYIKENCTVVDTEQRYNDMLDEVYSLESVGGLFACMSASRVLKEVDPTAYRCGKNDWADGEGFKEIDGDEYEASEVEKSVDSFMDDLESTLTDLESELEDLDEEDFKGRAPLERMIAEQKQIIADIRKEIASL